ncbi:MAG TPA: ice-binding family protein [Oligoflexus sp.]|uniref:ice-binding family protein n=1 Tax=Oligoflexus sp. TaxID=1971216 RepID=UPI002D58E731|nr:ice-binding family protein [Oligoflexus sp.]HYX34218.1 ice-binding family protein [Oligoflexus sp.]
MSRSRVLPSALKPLLIKFLTACALATFVGGCEDDNDSQSSVITASLATVDATVPIDAATNVAINRKVAATFSIAMSPTTLTAATFIVSGPDAAPLPGTVAYEEASKTTVFTPTNNFSANTLYKATLTTGVKDLEGHALPSDHVWTFTSGSTSDGTAPSIHSTLPIAGAVGVAINGPISVVFDEEMDPTTLNANTFSLKGTGSAAIAGTVTYTATKITFTPTANLSSNTLFTGTVTTGVKDLSGNPLANAYTLSFTTGSTAALGPAPVILGTSGDYVVLAKSAVSVTGATSVVGNIGLSPAAQSYLTGFSETLDATNVFATSSLVTGQLFAADMAAPTPSKLTTAIGNMETAYTDAAGRSLPDFTELGAGDVSGKTLAPGLYKWGTGLLMATDVTISGSANDVWIFQIAQDLTVSNGVKVILAGGALPKNIFWQVAGQVKLGTTVQFNGIILSQTKIVLETGAVLNGRALAQTAVTLDANAVTKPAN